MCSYDRGFVKLELFDYVSREDRIILSDSGIHLKKKRLCVKMKIIVWSDLSGAHCKGFNRRAAIKSVTVHSFKMIKIAQKRRYFLNKDKKIPYGSTVCMNETTVKPTLEKMLTSSNVCFCFELKMFGIVF